MTPKIFLGSSEEGQNVASEIQASLDEFAEVTVWDQGYFEISRSFMGSLFDALNNSDFGIFILSADDYAKIREQEMRIPRDNVIFELGLFIGRYGLERTFMVLPRTKEKIRLPSDLAGVTYATYNPSREDDNLRAAVSPACLAIKKAINKYMKMNQCGLPSKSERMKMIHYVPPAGASNEFFNRFFCSLSMHVSQVPGLELAICSPKGSAYETLLDLVPVMPPEDVALVFPFDVTTTGIRLLKKALNKNPKANVVFLDRQPPDQFLENYENTSFVGVNNRRVGVLAAYALYDELKNIERPRAYLIAEGPGGPERSNWCFSSIQQIDPSAVVAKIKIHDVDRIDTGHKISRFQRQFLANHQAYAIGFFGGNDETASSICHQAVEESNENIRVIGCDSTREMRQWIDNRVSPAFATMFNDLHGDDAIDSVISAVMEERIVQVFDPRYYPEVLQIKFEKDKHFTELWEKAK